MALEIEEDGGGIPEWVVTFGDMMSLLLTFFIMLFSMSELKEEEAAAVIESLRLQFGHEMSAFNPMPGNAPPLKTTLGALTTMGRASRFDTMKGGARVKAPVGDHARVSAIRGSKDATKGGAAYFDEGRAELTEENKRSLEATVLAIAGKPQKIEVVGHTSARPLDADSLYQNHWDLAYARCCRVMEFLIENGIKKNRLRLVVAAEYEPENPGTDESSRKRNARVEVLMMDRFVEDMAAGAEEKNKPISQSIPLEK